MRIKMALSLLLMVIIFPGASIAASTSVTVNWTITNPTNIVGYKLYYSYSSDMTAKQVGCETSNVAATSLTCSNLDLTPTTVYFSIAAVGTQSEIQSAVSSLDLGSIGSTPSDPPPDATVPAPSNLRIVNVSSTPPPTDSGDTDLQSHAINFQPAGSPIPVGFSVDSGETYSSARGYGWTTSPGSLGTRDRDNDAAPDQSYDTSILVNSTGVWELSLASGTYQVKICVGDPWYASSTNVVSAEGIQIVNDTVSSGNNFVEKSGTVTVNDGRLTITFQGSTPYSQLCWLTVSK